MGVGVKKKEEEATTRIGIRRDERGNGLFFFFSFSSEADLSDRPTFNREEASQTPPPPPQQQHPQHQRSISRICSICSSWMLWMLHSRRDVNSKGVGEEEKKEVEDKSQFN